MERAELTIQINHVHYHVIRFDQPAPELPSLFYLHGFGGCADNFSNLAGSLNRTVYAIDLLGHGKTESPGIPERYQLDAQLNDLSSIITALSDNDRPSHLLGYSMGGRLAMRLAIGYPNLFASLIIESSSPGIPEGDERVERISKDQLLAEKIKADMPGFFKAWNRLPLFSSAQDAPEDPLLKFEQRQLANNPLGLANNLIGFGAGTLQPVHDDLGRLPIPTCIITGETDEKYTRLWQILCKNWTNTHHEIIQGAGHRVHLDRPDTYIEKINHFLNQAESRL